MLRYSVGGGVGPGTNHLKLTRVAAPAAVDFTDWIQHGNVFFNVDVRNDGDWFGAQVTSIYGN